MSTGMVIGGFRLPTVGHELLINFASEWCDGDLDVIVCSRAEDQYPGKLRVNWLRDNFRPETGRFFNFFNDLPENEDEHPDFWNMWSRALIQVVGVAPEFLFASELYGQKLADAMGSIYVPIDPKREILKITSTVVRTNIPYHWDFIMPSARPHFVKKVAVIGPESCGKSTLVKKLAHFYETEFAPEWARTYLENTDPNKYPDMLDIKRIAIGQHSVEEAVVKHAKKIMFSDTDHICTAVWCKIGLPGQPIPEIVEKYISETKYDLRILLKDDVPFTEDILRYGGDVRQMKFEHFVNELESRNLPYVVVDGDWDNRFVMARKFISEYTGLM